MIDYALVLVALTELDEERTRKFIDSYGLSPELEKDLENKMKKIQRMEIDEFTNWYNMSMRQTIDECLYELLIEKD